MPRKKKAEQDAVPEEFKGKDAEKSEKEIKAGKHEQKIAKVKEKSLDEEKKEKLAKLKEKAEKLAKKIEGEVDISKRVKEEEKEYHIASVEDYLKSSIHLGTRVITPDMKNYVYKRRADGIAVFNTVLLDEKLEEGAEYLSKFAPEEVIVVCKREAGIKVMEMFEKATRIKTFTKYPSGILTNPNLDNFIEANLILICDPWIDKAVFDDAKRIKIPVLAVCDTNNYTQGVGKIIPGNNKSAKSLGFIFYHLAKIYIQNRKLDTKIPEISEWVEGWDSLVPPK